jgi:tRNA(Ile)-lysidine synthase
MPPLETDIQRARLIRGIERERLLSGVTRLLVACSGGSDSMALLELFAECREALGLEVLIVGHVDHGLRGAESDGDVGFVEDASARLGLRCLVERVDIAARRTAKGGGIEEVARDLRYAAFRRWAVEHDLQAVALGHQREDQQETVYLRLLRGSGVRGLAAIPPSRILDPDRGVRVVRPVLEWSRAELRAVLVARGVSWREDRSNQALVALRNRLRLEHFPRLETEFHAGARANLERVARHLRSVLDDLELLARRLLDESRGERAGTYRVEPWRKSPRSIVREALVLALRELDPHLGPPGERAFERFLDLLAGPEDRAVDLGGGARVDLRYGTLWWQKGRKEPPSVQPRTRLLVDAPPLDWHGWRIAASSREPLPPADATESYRVQPVDLRGLSTELFVAARQGGEKFRPLGAPGKKKLKELFRARQIPPSARDEWPLVFAGEELIWVAGESVAELCRVRDDSQPIWLSAARPR